MWTDGEPVLQFYRFFQEGGEQEAEANEAKMEAEEVTDAAASEAMRE